MKKLNLLTLLIVISFFTYAQQVQKGSVAYYESMRIAYQTKIDWVNQNPQEKALAIENHWFEMMDNNIHKINILKELAQKNTINNKSLNTDDITCLGARPLCLDDDIYTYPCGTDGTPAENGPDYGCLIGHPNPIWYYFQIAEAGELIMELSAPQDIDFIIWGPFSEPTCNYFDLTEENIIDCSYSSTNIETPEIGSNSSVDSTSAIEGAFYMMLITNYSGLVQDFTITQTGGDAIMQTCSLCPYATQFDFTASNCHTIELDTTTVSVHDIVGVISFLSTPSLDSIIIVKDEIPIKIISENLVSPLDFEVLDIITDSLSHNVKALFYSNDSTEFCSENIMYIYNTYCHECIANAGSDFSSCLPMTLNAEANVSALSSFWSGTCDEVAFENTFDPQTDVVYNGAFLDTLECQLIWNIRLPNGLNCKDTINTVIFPPAFIDNLDIESDCFCQNSEIQLSVNYNPNYNYFWQYPDSWTLNGDTNLITLSVDNQSGLVSVFATNFCGNSDTLSHYINILTDIPSTLININGLDYICPNSEQTYSVEQELGTFYNWEWPSEWTGTTLTNTLTVNTDTEGGLISVEPYNDCGLGESLELYVSIIPDIVCEFSYQEEMGIYQFNNESINAVSYYWDFGDGSNSSETSPYHEYLVNGTYIVRLTAFNICEEVFLEDTILINSVGIQQINSFNLRIYPNPAENVVTIALDKQQSGIIQISNSAGQIVFETRYANMGKLNVSVQSFEKGIYLIKNKQENSIETTKLIIE